MWAVCECGSVVGNTEAHAKFHEAYPIPAPEPPVEPEPEPEPTEEAP